MLLCAGHDDPDRSIYEYRIDARYWTQPARLRSIRVLDVDDDPSIDDDDATLKLGFNTAKAAVAAAAIAGGASDGGAAAVAEAYHSSWCRRSVSRLCSRSSMAFKLAAREYWSRSSRFSTFPIALRGSSVVNSTAARR